VNAPGTHIDSPWLGPPFQDGNYLEFIEAKSSSPAPAQKGSAAAATRTLDHYCQELAEKLANTVVHVAAHLLHRTDDTQAPLPTGMTRDGVEVARWRFVLVVPGHEDAWLPPLRDAVRRAIRATVACARLEEPIVLNLRLAQRFGLDLTSE